MKKWIVKVNFINGYDSIITLKTKDTKTLEECMAEYLNQMYGLSSIDYVEYDIIDKNSFAKNCICDWSFSTIIGRGYLEEIFKK